MTNRKNAPKKSSPVLTLRQAVEHYLTTSVLEGKSPETCLWYRKKLSAFATFMETEGKSAIVADLAVEDGREFIKALMDRKIQYEHHVYRHRVERGLSPLTIHGFVRALRAFATWVWEEGYTATDVFKPIKPPKVPKVVKQPLTEDEIRLLLAAIPQDTMEGARSYAMLLLFLDCGLRISELVNLKIEDVDLAIGELKVKGKGNKERYVPVGMTARKAVMCYKDQMRPEPANPSESSLFLTIAGYPMTRDSVEKVIQRLARRAHIERLHPHLLRHTAAVRYIKNGGDAFSLQRILGHESLEMTRAYVELANSDVAEKHRLFSPIDNLNLVRRRVGRPKSYPPKAGSS